MTLPLWTEISLELWQGIKADDWGVVERSTLSPMFPPIPLETLGFTQDSNFIYIPLSSLLPTGLSWQSISDSQWQEMTAAQWQGIVPSQAGATLSDNQLFYLLLFKLQAAALPAHQVKSNSSFFVVESRALVNSGSFNPNDY